MKRRTLFLAVIGVIVIGIASGVIWWLSRDTDPEENKLAVPTLSISERGEATRTPATGTEDDGTNTPDDVASSSPASVTQSPEATSTQLTDDTYRIYVFDNDQSAVNFTIESNVTDVSGTFDLLGRWFEFIYVPEEDAWRALLVLDIDGASVDTGSGLVDSLIRLGFEAERYPVGRFVGESETLVTDLSETNQIVMSGQVELSGQVRDLRVPVTFRINDGTLTANAQFEIDAREFGVDFPEGVGGNILDSKIRVVAHEADEATIDEIVAEMESLMSTPASDSIVDE